MLLFLQGRVNVRSGKPNLSEPNVSKENMFCSGVFAVAGIGRDCRLGFRSVRGRLNPPFRNFKQAASRPPGGFFGAKTSSETLRKRNGSFPSVKSDFPTPPGSPREAQPPGSGISNKHLQGLPGAFLAPKRRPLRIPRAKTQGL